MADEAPFQFLHNEVIQYIYKSTENGETVRNCPLITFKHSLNMFAHHFFSAIHSGERKKSHQTGEHGFQSWPRANREVTATELLLTCSPLSSIQSICRIYMINTCQGSFMDSIVVFWSSIMSYIDGLISFTLVSSVKVRNRSV